MKKPALDHFRNPQILLDLESAVKSLPEHLNDKGKELLDNYRALHDKDNAAQYVAGLIIQDAIGLLLFTNYAATACDLAVDYGCAYKVPLKPAQVALSRWADWAKR